jgi:hypothetical protein
VQVGRQIDQLVNHFLFSYERSNEADFKIGPDAGQTLYFWFGFAAAKNTMFPLMRLSASVISIYLGVILSVTATREKPIHTPRHVSYVESLGQVPLVNKANAGGQKVEMAQFGNWDNVEGERLSKFHASLGVMLMTYVVLFISSSLLRRWVFCCFCIVHARL